MLGQLGKDVVWRKRNVQEKRQRRKLLRHTSLPQRLGDVHQVVIVHPDEIVGLRGVEDRIRVALVNFPVSLPVCRFEIAEALQIMKERPDHLIRIAVVKFVAFCLAQAHWHDLVTGVARGFGQRLLVRDFARNSRPADPGAAAFAQHRLHRRDESAGGRRHGPKVFANRIQRERQPIGNDHQAIHLNNVKS